MHADESGPTGAIVEADGLEWYRIDDVDLLDPFLVTVTSPDDHWGFVSSSGAATLGRHDAGRSLFPYETDDRLHRAGGRTGPVTLLRVDGTTWQPFDPQASRGVVTRSLAATLAGDRLRFEERHPELGLTFRATLAAAGRHGWSRRCELVADPARAAARVAVLDGVVDVMPAGVPLDLQQAQSTLVDAYRRNEVDPATGASLHALEAAMTDGADPAESLRATLVWSRGLDDATVSLSQDAVRAFRSGDPVPTDRLTTGVKGAHLVRATVTVRPGEPSRWVLVGDVHLDHAEVVARLRWLAASRDPVADVAEAVDDAHGRLVSLVADQDGLQRTGDRAADGHHLANTLFNAMRGGVLRDGHRVVVAEVVAGARVRNASLADRLAERVADLPEVVTVTRLRDAVADAPQLGRLVDEHLPLTFGRRHGDPSRPWNRFRIRVHDEQGRPVTAYEGNWRDIFQNWEAMLRSFGDYLPSVVAKFLNASTRDGHNPYRIDHTGVDWEVPEDGSWAHFGYWGDHQLVYLHRLLDLHERVHPGLLAAHLGQRRHTFADVPYRIRPHAAIVEDPKHTIDFDDEVQAATEAREAVLGTDGRLVASADGGVHLASLAEKLLVPVLAKLSNLVPGGGVWMNTQRPEWNDANNALVGNGLSVVTTFHLRDALDLLDRLLAGAGTTTVPLDPAVRDWVGDLAAALGDHAALLDPAAVTPRARRSLLDRLGLAYERYRTVVHDTPPAPPVEVPVDDVRALLRQARGHVEVVTEGADRGDGHVDAYRLLSLGDGTAEVRPLEVMLEGQVAALASPGVPPEEVVATVDAMFDGPLLRPDHGTFMLYPRRELPGVLERNVVPEELVAGPLEALLDGASAALRRDADGRVRFAGDLSDARDLAGLLEREGVDPGVVEAATGTWEAVFDHASFTGRSGTMHRYEGIGSIYWHMVVKLLLAVQDRVHEAAEAGVDDDRLAALVARYRRVRDGLGYRGDVARFGAFPLVPHSHSPAHTGAQQPGMTGATKEGLLVRLGELGVRVSDGRVALDPVLLGPDDLLRRDVPWSPLGPGAELPAGGLGFTHCGVPVVYRATAGERRVRVTRHDGSTATSGPVMDVGVSRELLGRLGTIARIDADVRVRSG